ncbi:MAG: ABC transporter permease [Bacteroidota bacterium]
MTEEIIDSSERRLYNWRELWRYRELFYFFTWRDVKLRYKQTVLGFAWALLQPLVMMTIFTFFFGKALNIPSQSIPYPVYVLSGLVIWNFFSTGLTGAAQSMVGNAPIINKIYFPRLVIPVSAVLVSLFDFVIAFVLLIVMLVWYQVPVGITALLYWPLAVVAVVVATMGLGCGLAALNIKYRDIRYVIPFMVQILFFLTPVIYPMSMIKYPVLKYILVLSPAYAPVELFRIPLTGVMPDITLVSMSLISGLVFLIVGILYFRNTEDYFADYA